MHRGNARLTIAAAIGFLSLATPAVAENYFLGDSIAACFGNKPDCFAAAYSDARQERYKAVSIGGAQASDIWWHIQAIALRDSDRAFYMTGTNDLVRLHSVPAYVRVSKAALTASVYWLAGRTDAVRRSGLETGQWSDSLGTLGRMATEDGSTWSSTFTGDRLIMGYQLVDGLTSRFSVTVDGRHVGTFNHAPPTVIRTWHVKPPHNSAAPAMLRLTGFGAGEHTVTVTAHCAPDNPSPIEWLWQGPAAHDTFVLTTPRMTRAAYASIGSSDKAVDDYVAMQKSIVRQAQNDGMRVSIIDSSAAIVPDLHLSDGIHTNRAGNLAIARAIEAATIQRRAMSSR